MADRRASESDGGAATDGRMLRAATDQSGHGPLPWVAAPLRDADRVLDLCCGSGPLAAELRAGRWIGVHDGVPSVAPTPDRPRVVRGLPTAIPLRDDAVDGIAVLLALPRLLDLDCVFAELRRVLRPGGTLVVLVPSVEPRSLGDLRLARLLAPVHRGWRHRSALDRAGWLLAAADFAVMGDDRVPFALPLPDAAAARALVADLPRAGLWPSGLAPVVASGVAEGLARRAGPDRVLPVPLRRLVARR